MSNFGERLRQERKRLGLTQDELAEQGGVKKGAQFNYENGVRNPDTEYLIAIAAVGVNTQYLLHGEPSNENLSEDESELLFGYRGLDIRGKAGVLSVIDTLSADPKGAVTKKENEEGISTSGKKAFVVRGNDNAISTGKTINKIGGKKKDSL